MLTKKVGKVRADVSRLCIAAIVALSLGLAACGGGQATTDQTSAPQSQDPLTTSSPSATLTEKPPPQTRNKPAISENDARVIGAVEVHTHQWIAPATRWTEAYKAGTFGVETDQALTDLAAEYKGMVQASLGIDDPALRHAVESIIATYRLKLNAIGEINNAVASGDVPGAEQGARDLERAGRASLAALSNYQDVLQNKGIDPSALGLGG